MAAKTYAFIHVQCTAADGRMGTFIGINNRPWSPVFPDVHPLLQWMIKAGWRLDEIDGDNFIAWRVSRPTFMPRCGQCEPCKHMLATQQIVLAATRQPNHISDDEVDMWNQAINDPCIGMTLLEWVKLHNIKPTTPTTETGAVSLTLNVDHPGRRDLLKLRDYAVDNQHHYWGTSVVWLTPRRK